ncbi:two-component system, chemotaxis family, response regulator CheY [Paenibacillus sp. UNCCL117]|uniref:response regulator n=1 Tax=unclassified Paenibacillus TaxID=185978 RepID=UPI000886FDB8|nr:MULTISPECIES: response regulator [unclassified Paenibacillus]SDD18848.1 two-component system, chemotaxis family, response regulator CheY [Paenibacillus sp. cl123]SFW35338.1 two-component system, chemotaxis family, response regulator CheY [Paenibacillus sp. UNCCL117]
MAKVLVVDDAAFMRAIIGGMIKDLGHEVVGEAENGLDALQKYSLLKPDFVTLDITMPEMDGVEALRNIMKHDSSAKVVMCSAMGQQSLVIEAIKLGAKDFLVKPIQKDRVYSSLQRLLG